MSPMLKKLLSLTMALVLAFGVFATAAASDNPTAQATTVSETAKALATAGESVVLQSNSPFSSDLAATIILPGISQSDSTYCDDEGQPILDGDGKELKGGLLIIDSTNIVWRLVKTLLVPLLSSLLTQSVYKGLEEAVYTAVCDIFSIQKSDISGEPVNNLVVDTFNYPLSQYSDEDKAHFYNRLPMAPVIDEISETYGVDGEDYTYLYTFPLIGDPVAAGEGLADFIDMVKKQTGCKKVNLVAISMGGTVLAAYCDYVRQNSGDFSDINKIIGVVACFDGTDLFADFLARDFNLSDEFLYGEYIPLIMAESGSDEYVGHLLNIAIRILPKSVLYAILTAAMDGILDTLVINCPQFWSLVPSDRYEEIADKYISGEDYTTLRAKTDAFQQARLNLNSNLSYAAENYGTEIYTISGYGRQYDTGDYCYFGIAASTANSNSDSMIDIDSTSLGAAYAPAGETLSYTTAYTSPQGDIDASTCLSPNTAWFFNQQHHEVGRNDVIINLVGGIISGRIEDVSSSPLFPQFSYSRNTRALTRENGLMDKARTVLANDEGLYTQEQLDTVRPAYEKAAAMLEDLTLTPDSPAQADAITRELNDALAVTGLTTASTSTNFFVKFLNKLTAIIDSAVMKTVGGNGFFG